MEGLDVVRVLRLFAVSGCTAKLFMCETYWRNIPAQKIAWENQS